MKTIFKQNYKKTFSILIAIIFVMVPQHAKAFSIATTSPSAGNSNPPIDIGTDTHKKTGNLVVNADGTNPSGFTTTNSAMITSTVGDYTRLIFDDFAPDTAGYSGVHFLKAGKFLGGLFRQDFTNSIQIWNQNGPVLTVDQKGTTTLSGPLKIVDGTQGSNYVLTSDSLGDATWMPNGIVSELSVIAYFSWKRTGSGAGDWNFTGSNIGAVAPRTFPETSPYYIDVTFADQLSDGNYVVNCNGTRYPYKDIMWLAANNKSKTGFSVHGYIVASGDETPAPVLTLDCVIYGGGSNPPVYSNMLTKFTKSSTSLYNPGCDVYSSAIETYVPASDPNADVFSQNKDDLTLACGKYHTGAPKSAGAGVYSNVLTLVPGDQYLFTYRLSHYTNADLVPTFKLVSTGSGDYGLTSIGLDFKPTAIDDSTHTVQFSPTAKTGYLQYSAMPSDYGNMNPDRVSLKHLR
jgi:hypothetical protein